MGSGTRECVCQNCGNKFYAYNIGGWKYKRQDHRSKSETFGKILWFCTNKCMNEYEAVYPRKKYSKGFKNG